MALTGNNVNSSMTIVIQKNIEHEMFVEMLNADLTQPVNIIYNTDFTKYRNSLINNKQELNALGNIIAINGIQYPNNDIIFNEPMFIQNYIPYTYKSTIKDSLPSEDGTTYIDSLLAVINNKFLLSYIKANCKDLDKLHADLEAFKALITGSFMTVQHFPTSLLRYLYNCRLGSSLPITHEIMKGKINVSSDTIFNHAKFRLKDGYQKYATTFKFNNKVHTVFMIPFNGDPLEITSLVPDNFEAKVIVSFDGYSAVFNIYTPKTKNAREIALAFSGNQGRVYGNNYVATVKTPFQNFDMIKEGLNQLMK